jgi:hypothetical protein
VLLRLLIGTGCLRRAISSVERCLSVIADESAATAIQLR